MHFLICVDQPLRQARKRIADALPYWKTQLEQIGDVQFEMYNAMATRGPKPYIALAYYESETPENLVGICCFYLNAHRNDMFLQNLVVRSDCHDSLNCRSKLVECVIDMSQSYGFHGWVSTLPDEENVRELMNWRQLGFSRHDDVEPCYRRMGYFVR